MLRTDRLARPRLTASALLLIACSTAACSKPSVPDGSLTFARDGKTKSLSFADLAQRAPPETVTTEDPYYRATKRFRAFPLAPVLVSAFGRDEASLKRESFVLAAKDGYRVPIDGSRLLEGGAYIAIDDLDVPGFEPIGPRKVSPAPAYLFWTRPGQSDSTTHPRPWQLSRIECAAFESVYPHVVPPGQPLNSPAQRGFALFRERCIRCHAMNREGGGVGPDLNVPQSIVEYRPEPQIRQYIKDPLSFRYGAMPPHPDLGERELDQLIAYFRIMSEHKHDPEAQIPRPAH